MVLFNKHLTKITCKYIQCIRSRIQILYVGMCETTCTHLHTHTTYAYVCIYVCMYNNDVVEYLQHSLDIIVLASKHAIFRIQSILIRLTIATVGKFDSFVFNQSLYL